MRWIGSVIDQCRLVAQRQARLGYVKVNLKGAG